jgi:hypothetical protein
MILKNPASVVVGNPKGTCAKAAGRLLAAGVSPKVVLMLAYIAMDAGKTFWMRPKDQTGELA